MTSTSDLEIVNRKEVLAWNIAKRVVYRNVGESLEKQIAEDRDISHSLGHSW